MRVVVVGSGPAATAAVMALAARGVKPDVIDIGERLDERRAGLVATLAETPKARWSVDAVKCVANNRTVRSHVIPRKLAFGSDYIYARERSYGRVETVDVGFVPTHAAGGYSTVWGASMLPMHADDMSAWPISSNELENHYRAVAAALPLSGGRDALAKTFPLFREELGAVQPPIPTQVLLQRLQRRGSDCAPDHRVGSARLAVRDTGPNACVSCGLCLTGCPVGAIYSTLDTLSALENAGKMSRLEGRAVLSVVENQNDVVLDLLDTSTGTIEQMSCTHVFLAAGAVNSSRILLNSRKMFHVTAMLRDSQKLLLPTLLVARLGRVAWEQAISLSSIFVELKLPNLSPHWFHAQISSVNNLLLQRFGVDPFTPTPLLKRPFRALLNHVLIVWAGLHSDHSSAIALTIRPDHVRGMPTVRLSALRNPAVPNYANTLARAIARLLRSAGALVVPTAGKLGLPGDGGHVGGSFPMRKNPSADLETDPLGRPFGWRRVYLVDGACMPSIPGTTPTFTIMANAHRIASIAELE